MTDAWGLPGASHSCRRNWSDVLAQGAYRGLTSGVLPLALPGVTAHPHMAGGALDRLGLVSGLPSNSIWFHGASVGDVSALKVFAERMARRGDPVVFSCWTRSAKATIAEWSSSPPSFYLPLDTLGSTRRLLRRLAPRLLVLEGLEIWPNLLAACAERAIPVVVVNGRLSETSARSYRRLRWLFGPCFESLKSVTALDQGSAERFVRAGVGADRVCVGACTKHLGLTPASSAWSTPFTVVLGSIHWAEARQLFPLLAEPIRAGRLPRMVIAPRYPSQARGMHRQLRRLGVPSRLGVTEAGSSERVEILDRMGALRKAYGRAAVAFVGGSLVSRGGHNVVEAASQGVPVIVGPHHQNCQREVDVLSHVGGAVVVADASALIAAVTRFVANAEVRRHAAQGAVRGSRQLAGEAEHTASRLELLCAQLRSPS